MREQVSQDSLLEDPSVQALLPRPDIPFLPDAPAPWCRQGGRPSTSQATASRQRQTTHREKYKNEFE
ncbi:hypothetical protein PIB30_020306 [Stylosanthes scabra]|uniref:Uncharacterized protein n=1 Tax=Stylosanthes scabra TaxID=79078 RepID=A0ABU6W6J0_9FABA|nr:hypothetical protein [Stylosanthes scabra]